MKITVISFGTEGDTRPLVALSKGLQAKGHQVSLLAEQDTLAAAQAHGVTHYPLAGSMKAAIHPEGEFKSLMNKGGDVTQVTKALAKIAEKHTADWMRMLVEHARDSDAIVFSGISSYVGLSVAEYLKIPAIGAGLWPISPTRAFPSPLIPQWQLGGWFNQFSHRVIGNLMWYAFRKTLNQARQQVCGQAARKQMWQKYPILYGVSPQIVPQPADWQDTPWEMCGAWSLTPSENWQAPESLQEFLAAGQPPIYVGFGSMTGFDQQKILKSVIYAVAGQRALFFSGWSGIDKKQLPTNFYVVGDTPHHWLLPQTALAIHHGGAGTSHAAASAGVPSVVVPFAADQFFWAARLAERGVAPMAAVASHKLTPEILAAHIRWAQQDSIKAQARQLGQLIEQENGVAKAVEKIEFWIKARRLLS